jgi:hypothetical protein
MCVVEAVPYRIMVQDFTCTHFIGMLGVAILLQACSIFGISKNLRRLFLLGYSDHLACHRTDDIGSSRKLQKSWVPPPGLPSDRPRMDCVLGGTEVFILWVGVGGCSQKNIKNKIQNYNHLFTFSIISYIMLHKH